jgi:iron-sulfur cluster assembly protein
VASSGAANVGSSEDAVESFAPEGSGTRIMATETKTQDTPAVKAGPTIHLTERAAKKIIALLAKDGVSAEVGGLRVGVQGGGCSGLSYAMRLDTQSRDRDKVFEEFGARIFVDPKSLLYLNGTTLEYEETLMREGFVFQNPNADRSCGCGSSFTA